MSLNSIIYKTIADMAKIRNEYLMPEEVTDVIKRRNRSKNKRVCHRCKRSYLKIELVVPPWYKGKRLHYVCTVCFNIINRRG